MFKKSLVSLFVLFWIVLAISPVNRDIWLLENILVVTLFPVVLWLDKKYTFTNWAFFGAHLTYEKMTYFIWFSEWFGWERNYYDQVIHFCFGLLVFVPFFEIFYHQGYSRKLSYLIAFLFITGVGCWYEILEWIAMLIVCSEPGCSLYITQGDEWDTQKDMAYSVAGAFITLLIHSRRNKSNQKGGYLESE
jgi:putative membrane protein